MITDSAPLTTSSWAACRPLSCPVTLCTTSCAGGFSSGERVTMTSIASTTPRAARPRTNRNIEGLSRRLWWCPSRTGTTGVRLRTGAGERGCGRRCRAGRVEPERRAGAGAEDAVPVDVLHRHVGWLADDRAVPWSAFKTLPVLVRPSHGPAVEARRAGVLDGDLGLEVPGPVARVDLPGGGAATAAGRRRGRRRR